MADIKISALSAISAVAAEDLIAIIDDPSGTPASRYLPPSGLYDRVLKVVEKPLIERTLIATKGNQIKAAKVLGINRNTLRKKIRELDIRIKR